MTDAATLDGAGRCWLDEDREGLRIHWQLMGEAAVWERAARDVSYLYWTDDRLPLPLSFVYTNPYARFY